LDVEESLHKRLKDYTGLKNLVSTRVYPDVLPQGVTYPAVTYSLVIDGREHAMGSDPGIYGPTYQVTAWAETKSSAKSVAAQIESCLKDFSGVMGGTGGVTVQRIFADGELSAQFYPDEGKEGVWGIPLQYVIWYGG
jgi:hypothetical protein